MDATPPPRRPSGRDLLAGTPEALEHWRALAPTAFPDGIPTAELTARVAAAIWHHLRTHPGSEPVVGDPEDADARISAAFQREGLAAAFAEAASVHPAGASARLRVAPLRRQLLP
ncbi:MAG: hypothetical protein ACLQT7_09010 [Candidatus Dormibacteria bacterium]